MPFSLLWFIGRLRFWGLTIGGGGYTVPHGGRGGGVENAESGCTLGLRVHGLQGLVEACVGESIRILPLELLEF